MKYLDWVVQQDTVSCSNKELQPSCLLILKSLMVVGRLKRDKPPSNLKFWFDEKFTRHQTGFFFSFFFFFTFRKRKNMFDGVMSQIDRQTR